MAARYLFLNTLCMRAYGIHGETSSLSAGPNLAVSCGQRGSEHGSYYLTRSDSTRPLGYDDETR
jgi:hypothetical protein